MEVGGRVGIGGGRARSCWRRPSMEDLAAPGRRRALGQIVRLLERHGPSSARQQVSSCTCRRARLRDADTAYVALGTDDDTGWTGSSTGVARDRSRGSWSAPGHRTT